MNKAAEAEEMTRYDQERIEACTNTKDALAARTAELIDEERNLTELKEKLDAKQKEIKKFRDAMQKGDKVTTAGGIHGKIKEIKNDVIVLQIDDNVKITIDKAMVYPSASDAVESGNDIKNNPNPN